MECKIVTIGLSRDDSPKRRSIRVTENSVRVSSDDGTTKGTLWPSLRAICEWRMYVIRFIFEASDRISHTYEESYDVKIKFIVITKAWKGDLVDKSALPVRLSTLWIIKLTMCPSYEFFNTCFRPRPWIWTHKTTRVTTCTLCGPNTINSRLLLPGNKRHTILQRCARAFCAEFSRSDENLRLWRQSFCCWIMSLPLAVK